MQARHLHLMHILYVHMYAYVDVLHAVRSISNLVITCTCFPLIVMVLEVATAFLSSAVHVVHGACLLCIRVRCVHSTVQVSSFYFQPKGEGKVRLHAASIELITAGRSSLYKPPSNEIP